MITAESVARQGNKYLGTPYTAMDCQAFFEACLADAGISRDLKGSNAWYRDMTWTGSPEKCKKCFGSIPAGAFLFIHAFDGGEAKRGYHDGLGNASHIGIYTGTGDGAIHSSQSRGCVATSKFAGKTINGGWNMVGLWDRLSYGAKIDAALAGLSSETVPESTPIRIEVKPMDMIVKSANGAGVRMRKTASATGAYMCTIPEGSVLSVTETKAGFGRVYHEGLIGWANLDYLAPVEDTADGSLDESVTLQLSMSVASALCDALKAALGDT